MSAKKNKFTLLLGIVFAVLMLGFAFALVPLYNVLCARYAINGKVVGKAVAYDAHAEIDGSRSITVQFLGVKNANLSFTFEPEVRSLQVHPGAYARAGYVASNLSGKDMTIQAIPSVSPALAAKYLKKTECFCFTRQRFSAGEKRALPMLFHLDKELPKHIQYITLSYTLFDTAKITRPMKRPERGL